MASLSLLAGRTERSFCLSHVSFVYWKPKQVVWQTVQTQMNSVSSGPALFAIIKSIFRDLYFEILTSDSLMYTLNNQRLSVANIMENSISILRVVPDSTAHYQKYRC